MNHYRTNEYIRECQMRIDGEPITAVVEFCGKPIVFTENRTYMVPHKQSLRSRIRGSINRFFIRMRRMYGV